MATHQDISYVSVSLYKFLNCAASSSEVILSNARDKDRVRMNKSGDTGFS
jgi:hypothetical protein